MDLSVPATAAELSAAVFQAVITGGLMLLCLWLFRQYGKTYFGIWAVAWGVYTARMWAILSFLATRQPVWLYWHQVATGWTALVILWAALVFARQTEWKRHYFIALLFPPVWSYLAIYRLDSFFLAAWPAVLFLSSATFFTAWTFLKHHRRIGSGAALLLSVTFFLWSAHHLDYPLLRARGIWNPWGYYLDVLFSLLVGMGLLLLVLDDLARGVETLSTLSTDLQGEDTPELAAERLVERPLQLPAVSGSALYLMEPDEDARLIAASGVCRDWSPEAEAATLEAAARVRLSARFELVREPVGLADDRSGEAYAAALPLFRDKDVIGSMVVVGSARDPFAALDDRFLVALGRQVGAALENAGLNQDLHHRSEELGRLATAMVRQHEEERARLSRELHDETAQVLAALNFQLAALARDCPPDLVEGLAKSRELLRDGIRGIRTVTEGLRPPLLDELGLIAALRALTDHFSSQSGVVVHMNSTDNIPLPPEGEVAIFRAVQEGLSNAVRHGKATEVDVELGVSEEKAILTVSNDGTSLEAGDDPLARAHQRGGLRGMQERITALGGGLSLAPRENGGAILTVEVPMITGEQP
jgi:signal transduction histidine kinase